MKRVQRIGIRAHGSRANGAGSSRMTLRQDAMARWKALTGFGRAFGRFFRDSNYMVSSGGPRKVKWCCRGDGGDECSQDTTVSGWKRRKERKRWAASGGCVRCRRHSVAGLPMESYMGRNYLRHAELSERKRYVIPPRCVPARGDEAAVFVGIRGGKSGGYTPHASTRLVQPESTEESPLAVELQDADIVITCARHSHQRLDSIAWRLRSSAGWPADHKLWNSMRRFRLKCRCGAVARKLLKRAMHAAFCRKRR